MVLVTINIFPDPRTSRRSGRGCREPGVPEGPGVQGQDRGEGEREGGSDIIGGVVRLRVAQKVRDPKVRRSAESRRWSNSEVIFHFSEVAATLASWATLGQFVP